MTTTMKLREHLVNVDTFDVGTTEIARGKVVVLNNGVIDASGANAAKRVGIICEIGYANGDAKVAGPGSTVLALAADADIAEGDLLISDADGKVDSVGAASATAQYVVGMALRESDAEDQLIPVLVLFETYVKGSA